MRSFEKREAKCRVQLSRALDLACDSGMRLASRFAAEGFLYSFYRRALTNHVPFDTLNKNHKTIIAGFLTGTTHGYIAQPVFSKRLLTQGLLSSGKTIQISHHKETAFLQSD